MKLLSSAGTINVQTSTKEKLSLMANLCHTLFQRIAAKIGFLNYGADSRIIHSAAGKSIELNSFYKITLP